MFSIYPNLIFQHNLKVLKIFFLFNYISTKISMSISMYLCMGV